jgi:hypothetical protein
MNGVYGRNPKYSTGEPGKKTSLEGVQMEKIWSQFPDQLPNLPEGSSIREWPDFPLQMGQYVNRDGSFATSFRKEAFFSGGNTYLEVRSHGAC